MKNTLSTTQFHSTPPVKKTNEFMAHSYSHLFALPTTGLRFFTVYGPWGRPDMAYFKFVKKILNGDSIDIIPSANTAWSAEHPDPSSSYAPY